MVSPGRGGAAAVDAGAGGATLAADDIAGIHHQRVKIQYGADGSATDVSDASPLPVDDAGGSLTVDGTVTANLSAVDNAVIDTIELNTDYGKVVGGGVEATALRVTLANDSTGLVSVDDGGGALTVDNGGTFAVQSTLQAGANAIGKLASNTGVDIGDVDVTSVVPGTAATNLGKAEDAGHASGDVGVMALSVRQNTAAALSGADADYQPLITDTNGRLHVLDANSAAIKTAVELIDDAISGNEMQVDVVASLPAGTNAIGKLAANTGVDIGDVDVTSIVPGTGATNLGKAEDAAHSSSDVGVMALGVRNDDLAALGGADGDYAPLQVDPNGALCINDCMAELKHFHVTPAGGGASEVIAAVADRAFKIHSLSVISASTTANTMYFEESGGTDVFGDATEGYTVELDGTGGPSGIIWNHNAGGWFKTTTANTALDVNQSAAQGCIIAGTYTEYPA